MPSGRPKLTIELRPPAEPAGAIRRKEPLTVGVPLPVGLVRDAADVSAFHSNIGTLPMQATVLDRWFDGSIRWMLVDTQADIVPGATLSLVTERAASERVTSSPIARFVAERIEVGTGVADFVIGRDRFPFRAVSVAGRAALDPGKTGFFLKTQDGGLFEPRITHIELETNGPLRASVRIDATFDGRAVAGLQLVCRLHFVAGHASVGFELTMRNSRRAHHKGGFWELGDPGSVRVSGASIAFGLVDGSDPISVRCSETTTAESRSCELPFEVYQHSSGGENWRSPVHVDAAGAVPFSVAGYTLTAPGVRTTGRRATPLVQMVSGHHQIALTAERFWENFPKAIHAADRTLTLHVFPDRPGTGHELQGGEQKTHSFWIALAEDGVGDRVLEWVRNPSRAVVDPRWCCASGAVPFLTPRAEDPHGAYLALVDSAIEGPDTFVQKREAVDEYGWRHFGEVWADHEAVFHPGATPLVSHYNNQYDAIGGFICQYLRSGNPAWWMLMDDLARHVIDIDIYHTDSDWPKYNHGLFWHTVHYKDAGRSTHRSYPHSPGVNGGGPSAGHLYTTGLLHHYFLTGSAASREAVIELATFVIDSDDGRQSVFRWLDRGRTGYASESGSPDYHGPGRAPANAVNALIDAHRLTGEARFLIKAEELLRRCIHPSDDIDARQLLDAERRWFYTMFLQSLGKFLHHKRERSQIDAAYAYARESLLSYARWMAAHERPYLEHPEQLEYPTETWAAQDMRKSEVFKWAALHASADEERERFMERSRFFFDYSVQALSAMSTRTLARPVILLLSFGWSHAAFMRDVPAVDVQMSEHYGFGRPQVFVPQKPRALRRALLVGGLLAAASLVGLGWYIL